MIKLPVFKEKKCSYQYDNFVSVQMRVKSQSFPDVALPPDPQLHVEQTVLYCIAVYCIVITGAIRGTSKERIYQELGLESLESRH